MLLNISLTCISFFFLFLSAKRRVLMCARLRPSQQWKWSHPKPTPFPPKRGRIAAILAAITRRISFDLREAELLPFKVNSRRLRVKGFALCEFFIFVWGGSRAYTSKRVAEKHIPNYPSLLHQSLSPGFRKKESHMLSRPLYYKKHTVSPPSLMENF